MEESDLPIRPGHFALLSSLFGLAMALLAPIARRRGRSLDPIGPMEATQLAMAVYTISRVATQEKAGVFVRAPFTEPKPDVDLEQVAEEKRSLYGSEQMPKGEGLTSTFGQLVTCSRCFGMWGAGALMYLRTLAPAQSRVLVPTLALAGSNFFLQAIFSRLVAKANIAEAVSEQVGSESAADLDEMPDDI